MATKSEIGRALSGIREDVIRHTLSLVAQYREADERLKPALMRQAVDTPHRARAQVAAWMDEFDAMNEKGAAQQLLIESLAAAGAEKTLAEVDGELAAIEGQALELVNLVNRSGWTWDQVAEAIEIALTPNQGIEFSYRTLPMPKDYVSIWGLTERS